MFDLYQTSNPYEYDYYTKDNGDFVIVMGVDQLYVDPDINEQKVITEYYERELND